MIAGILFLIFLMQYNKIEKTELLSTEGRTFEKAVVTEVISDNLTENGNRVGNQTVRLRLCSGKFKNEKWKQSVLPAICLVQPVKRV